MKRRISVKIFCLMVLLCISIKAQDVNVDNIGSVTISADNTASGTGKIVFQTKNLPRFTISNNGNVGIGNESTGALFDVFTLPASGPKDLWRWRINDGATADGASFNMRFTSSAQDFGDDPRHDNVMGIGYNVDSPTIGEPTVALKFENRYQTNVGFTQSEVYFEAGAAGHYTRPIGYSLDHATGMTEVSLNTYSLLFSNPSQTNIYLRSRADDDGAKIQLLGDSEIDLRGSSHDWPLSGLISRNVIGNAGGTYGAIKMFDNASEVNFFPLLSTGSSEMYLTFGGSGGGWTGLKTTSTGRMQTRVGSSWQYLTSSSSPYPNDWASVFMVDSANRVGMGVSPGAASLHIKAATATGPVLIVQSDPTNGNNLQQWRKSDGTVRTYMSSNGSLYLAEDDAGLQLRVGGVYNNGGLYKPTGIMQFSLGADQSFSFRRANDEVLNVNYAGVVYLKDGTMKPVTFAADNSCGEGFKCLRIAN